MNILILITASRGGLTRESFEIAKGFGRNNCTVYAIVPNDIENRQDWDNAGFIEKVFHLQQPWRGMGFFKRWITRSHYVISHRLRLEIKKYFNDIHFDFILKYWWHPLIDSIFNQLSIKHSFTFWHNPIPHSGAQLKTTFLERKFIQRSENIVVLSKLFIPLLNKQYGKQVNNIYYFPLGIQDYKRCQNSEIPIKYNKKTNFLFFGEIKNYKGLFILADAYKQVSEKLGDEVSLTIAGSGDFTKYENDFAALRNLQVFNRWIPDNEVGSYFTGHNIIVILPYLDATQSGVVPITIDYSIPVIASNTGGLKEQLLDGAIGMFFEAGNSGELAKKMLFAAEDPEWRNEQVRLIESFKHKYQYDNIVKDFLDTCRQRYAEGK
ncbi:MAG: glycosyltransferase family 4 protein [Oscillospiraceae bacterium]|nr:glycosyltransferase family 4 protein [Oscillospiraceae bacterium]